MSPSTTVAFRVSLFVMFTLAFAAAWTSDHRPTRTSRALATALSPATVEYLATRAGDAPPMPSGGPASGRHESPDDAPAQGGRVERGTVNRGTDVPRSPGA